MRRAIIVIVLVVALAAGITVWLRARSNPDPNAEEMQTAKVQRGTVTLTVSSDGVLQPLTTVAVKSYAGGRVDVLAVEVGDLVKADDLIAKIDPTDSLTSYEQARADLEVAQARRTQAREQADVQPTMTRAAIAQAEANHNAALKDLQRLQRAEQPQTRAQARATLEKAKANLDIAEKEMARVQGLKAQGFVPQSDVDSALNRRDLAKAELTSVQERWDTLQDELVPGLESAQARVAQAKAGLNRAQADSVQDRLRNADVASAKAQVRRAEAQVRNAEIMLKYTTILAPRAGVILQKYVEQGTIITSGRSSVAQGTDIVQLGDLTKMFVEVSLDEADVGKVHLKQTVDIRVEAFPDEPFRGAVTRVNPQAVSQQNIATVLVTVQIENPDARLKPGMTASCDFLVEKVEDTLYLASRAIREQSGEHLVTVMRNGKQVDVTVEVGIVGNERTEILDGLREGAEVILPTLVSQQAGAGADYMRERGRRAGGMGSFFRGPGP